MNTSANSSTGSTSSSSTSSKRLRETATKVPEKKKPTKTPKVAEPSLFVQIQTWVRGNEIDDRDVKELKEMVTGWKASGGTFDDKTKKLLFQIWEEAEDHFSRIMTDCADDENGSGISMHKYYCKIMAVYHSLSYEQFILAQVD